MALAQSQTLANGVKIPVIGFGVAQIPDGVDTYNSVKSALEQGYRHIDTAAYYKNEESVGRAIRECGIPREEIFLTTKLWNADQGYETTLAAFDASLKRLGLDYVDLYLIHWPGKDKFVETWKAFEHLYKEKKIRAIGVSNFQIHHLETLKKEATVMPMLDQIELHPWLTQVELREYCAKNNIVVTAWSPLAQGKVLNEPVLAEIGKKHNKSPAQVIIRWDLQSNIVTIPKSATPARIVQNSQVFDFELSAEEVAAIDALNQNKRIDYDPDTYF